MIKIDALLFMFIVEAMLLAIGLSAYLFHISRKYKDISGRAEKEKDDAGAFIRKLLDNRLGRIKQAPAEQEGVDGEIARESNSVRLRFYKGAADKLGQGDYDIKALMERLVTSFEEITDGQMKSRKELLLEKEALSRRLEGSMKDAEALKGEMEKAGETIAESKKETAESRDKLMESMKNLDDIQKRNAALKEKIAELCEKTAGMEAVMGLLGEFEQNNKELDMSVRTLEKENRRLVEECDSLKNEAAFALEQKEREKSSAEDKLNRMNERNEKLQERTADIEEKLDNKTKEMAALQKKYDVLEKEYAVLYKESQ